MAKTGGFKFLRKRDKRGERSLEPTSEALSFEFFRNDGSAKAERKSATTLPRFKVLATGQLDRRRSDTFESVRVKLRTAFTPSQPVMDQRMFAGRLGILSSMIRSIEDQRLHLVLYGDRGIGKTSLLHMLTQAAGEARYIVVYTSCGAGSNFDETFRGAAHEIPLLFHSGFTPTASEAESGSTMADLLPTSQLSPRQFGDLCGRITSTRVLIILDEFDRCENPQFRRDLAELIKMLSDRSLRVQLVIAGVAADLAELVEHIPSIRRNILAIRVPLMEENEVHEIIANGQRVSGMTFDEGAREMVTTVAHGSPYITNLLCHHAGLVALDAKRMNVMAEDVAVAVEDALGELKLRIAKPLQLQVDRALTSAGDTLINLAYAALSTSGRFEASDITATAPTPEAAAVCKRFANELAKERVLLEAMDEGYGMSYKFIDDGVPLYLTFMAAHQGFKDHEKTTQKVRRA